MKFPLLFSITCILLTSQTDLSVQARRRNDPLPGISNPNLDFRESELSERLRLRRGGRGDTSEDDEGLPHSPCNSPTASDGLLDKTAIKDLQTKSHSTCSDGSLLSVDSYVYVDDEDSMDLHSRCSSKVELREKSTTPDTYLEFGPSSHVTPLNHSAAHHRVSVKPKRTHGAPRRTRGQQLSLVLPVTPEVNEESSIRSLSPATTIKAPGAETNKLNRSKSNAGSKSQDPLHEDREKEEKPSLFDRIFPRKSGRKKREKKEEKEIKQEVKVVEGEIRESHWEIDVDGNTAVMRSHTESSSTMITTKPEVPKPTPAPRSGAASRQRVLPIDIPATPDGIRKESTVLVSKASPEKSPSPLQAELENRFKNRQISLSTSPPISLPKSMDTPPQSPRKSPRSPRLPERQLLPTVITASSSKQANLATSSSITTKYSEMKTRNEEFRGKIKMPGLSSLQQRVLSLNDDDIDSVLKSFEKLTKELKVTKPVTKSHSFKAMKPYSFDTATGEKEIKSTTAEFLAGERQEQCKSTVTKAASLDSVKQLDEPVHFSEVKLELKKSKPDVGKVVSETEKNDDGFREFIDSPITISGPSHTAIVNVTSNNEGLISKSHSIESGVVDGSRTISIKEHQVSVTKIQVKRESTQLTQSTVTIPTTTVPEFINKQLNRVEIRPNSNIILSMKSPRIVEEQDRPKTLFDFDVDPEMVSKPLVPRKFSKENLEIIEKDSDSSPNTPPAVTVNSQPTRFKKLEAKNSFRKSSVISISPESPTKDSSKSRSASLDSLKSDANESDKSSRESLEKLDEKMRERHGSSPVETVMLRKKSVASKKKEDEPELMKVFARRSLKLKDSDEEALHEQLAATRTRDSDKENQSDSSPVEDRKKMFSKTTENTVEAEFLQRRKSLGKDLKKDDVLEIQSPIKEPLLENKVDDTGKNKAFLNGSPVLPRKPVSNIFLAQRPFSVNPPKSAVSEMIVKKQSSFSDRKKSDQWMTNIKNEESEVKEKGSQDNIIKKGGMGEKSPAGAEKDNTLNKRGHAKTRKNSLLRKNRSRILPKLNIL
ncbi:hypothetical protein JTB14_017154 [Gonioctena quinquepunctata]|nr:hypothetical protein JTB14_017154 [Gonioctena quinquepunctata]